MLPNRRRFCGEPHESGKPPKSNLFINEWGFVDDELPIRYTLYAVRYFFHFPRCKLHAKRYFLPRYTLYAIRYFLPRYTLYAPRFTLRQDQRAQKNLFMQNKPNFPRFCAKNGYLEEKQTQTKPIQSQFKPNTNPIKPKTNPIKPNFLHFFSNRRLVILTTFFISRISPFLLFLFSARYSLKNLIRSLSVTAFVRYILSCTRFLTRSRKGSLRNFFVRSLSRKKSCRPSLFFRPSTFPSRISP